MAKRRPIPGFSGYAASTDGRIWTYWTRGQFATIGGVAREMKQTPQWSGHLSVTLSRHGRQYKRRVHRLVLLTFVGECPKGKEGCHYPDRNPANCTLKNLRWATSKENKQDAASHGTIPIGANHRLSKLTVASVRKARKLYKQGKLSLREVGAKFGVGIPTIYCAIIGKTWKHVS